MATALEQKCINTIRMLAIDMVEAAKSGHPGMPLGAAPMTYLLWTKCMRHNPVNPNWWDRDRFILSAGHGSALLYALLHLSGYDLSLEECKRFRQWESKTAGHPELHLTPGVEMTTGPLGQGFATGVGMAIAERKLATEFNRDGFNLIHHYIYGIVSDGDLMEGVAAEAASLAGHLRLGKLIYLYDDNHISIEGDTALAFSEEVDQRFQAYGWQTQKVGDGNDLAALSQAIDSAKRDPRPSLILVRTHIGFGSPKQDTAAAHGEPLGKEALLATKEHYGWPLEKPFYVPDDAASELVKVRERGIAEEAKWQELYQNYRNNFPELAKEFNRRMRRELANGWEKTLPKYSPTNEKGKVSLATRVASGQLLNQLAKQLPELMGGSADLAPSTKTLIDGSPDFSADQPGGRNLRFGVREHAMGCAVNGMALHGGVLPYAATFFVFSDYMRPSIRMAAIMNQKVIYIFTHDSIGLGEDGPTHQPIEHLASLRAMPNLSLIRPADANETVEAWKVALKNSGPTALVLTRQNLPVLDTEKYPIQTGFSKGGYILADSPETPAIILIASGSEVHLALATHEKLATEGVPSRVVSLPSWDLFTAQSNRYRNEVLPPEIHTRLAIEAGSTFGWSTWVGDRGHVIGLNRFGASAPYEKLMDEFGFNIDHLVQHAYRLLKQA